MRLGTWLDEAGRTTTAIDVLKTVNLVDPLDPEVHEVLGDLLLESGRAAESLTEFQVLLAMDPHDKASAWYRLASANHALGSYETSRTQLLQALDLAPNFRPAQRLLLESMRADGASDDNQGKRK